MNTAARKPQPLPYVIMTIGIIAVSFAAIFIRIADDAPAIVIAAYRLILATVVMTPFSLRRAVAERVHYSRRTILLNILSGAALALHFVCWIASLKYTSVARSVLLVATNPFFVAIMGRIVLKEKIKTAAMVGMVLALAGIFLMSALNGGVTEGGITDGRFTGDILALAGAFFAAVYMLFGRHIRQTVSTTAYAYMTYGVAAAVLVVVMILTGASWTGYASQTYLMFLLLALVPQIIGHTSFNYALKFLPAVSVSIVILGEPVGAAFLAWIFLGEGVSLGTFIGGAIILSGVFLTVYSQNPNQKHDKNTIQNENPTDLVNGGSL
jgi:drug/metabolite transporter (DMT)-like permease